MQSLLETWKCWKIKNMEHPRWINKVGSHSNQAMSTYYKEGLV